MPDIRFHVANCLLCGDRITQRGDSWIRNLVEFNCDGRIFIFTQHDEIIKGSTKPFIGKFCESTQVTVQNVKSHELKKVVKAMDSLCWLLSFAGGSRVICYGYDYPADQTTGIRKSVSGLANDFRPAFDLRDAPSVKNFITQAFPSYTQLEQARKLNVIFDYLVFADLPSQPTELRLISSFIILESLKDTFAKSKSIPYKYGAYRRGAARNSPRYNFEELLKLMFKEVRMNPGLKKISRLRNEIIHSGLSRLKHSSQWAIYERTQDLIREYILRLLGYKGEYLPYKISENRRRAI